MPILDYLVVSTVQGERKCNLLNRHEHFPSTAFVLYVLLYFNFLKEISQNNFGYKGSWRSSGPTS